MQTCLNIPSRPSLDSAVRFREFKNLKLYRIEELFGSWDQAWQENFSPQGSFDKIMSIRDARSGGSE